MNQGLVEQVGPPFEIYNFPKTSFVAQFVGTLNTVTATVQEPATGALNLSGQTIYAALPLANRRAGDTVKMALRPELLTPESTGESDENQLIGVVENVTFLGAVVRLQVRVGDTLLLVDEFNNPHLAVPAIGDTFTVYFRRENGLLLDA